MGKHHANDNVQVTPIRALACDILLECHRFSTQEITAVQYADILLDQALKLSELAKSTAERCIGGKGA